jgi:two-component system, OmpR family, response regulator ChvI
LPINNEGIPMFSYLSEIVSKNLSKYHKIQDNHDIFLSSYKIDSSTTNIVKQHRPKKTERNGGNNNNNNNDVLANTNTNSSNSQTRIMIVDDEHDIARLFAIGLERNGFAVDMFNDPLSALSNYKAGLYDLLLLDIRMPTMDGFELYQKIKGKDEKVKVCFVTAYEESINDFKELFPNLEVDCFVRKPIEIDNLVKIVRSKLN